MEKDKIAEVEKYRKMYKDGLKIQIRGLVIGAIIGLVLGIMMVSSGDAPFYMCFFMVYEFAGIGLGWRTVNNILNKLFGNMVIWGTAWFWFVAFFIKLCIAACIGLFELPIFIIKTIIDYKKTMAMADNIINDAKKAKEE